jgi:hypothetical protein
MKTFTVDEVMAWRPCEENYPRKRVSELWAGRDAVSIIDVLDMDIPDEDVVWFACRAFDDRQRVIFVCKCAEDAGMGAWASQAAAARAAARERQLLYTCETLLETEEELQ